MKFRLIATLAVGLLITGIVAAAAANPSSGRSGPPHLVSAFGKAHVGGQVAAVHVVAVVPDGSRPSEVGAAALAAQGARPITSTEYSLITLKHPDTSNPSDGVADAQFNYISNSPAPDGVTALSAEAAVSRALDSWIAAAAGINQLDVKAMGVPAPGTTCPSLVRECEGPQFEDGSNDIGWADIKGKTTLGVTWSTATEADIALDIHQKWILNIGSGIDVETVALHEIGHGLGLGHSDAAASETVMNAYYGTVNQTPGSDDIAGLKCKYDGVCDDVDPAPAPTGTPIVEAQSDTRAGGGFADRDLVITVDTSAPGAAVTVWLEYLAGGDGPWTGTKTANDQGVASFRLRNAPTGAFVNTVTSIVAPWGECGTSGSPSCENGAINPYSFTSP